jgi:hypothetical protein
VFEAILSQLMFKELAGDRRAAARLKYQEFVCRRQGPRKIVYEFIHIGVVVVGRPMMLQVVEKGWPVSQA